jgi:hypothetical protein
MPGKEEHPLGHLLISRFQGHRNCTRGGKMKRYLVLAAMLTFSIPMIAGTSFVYGQKNGEGKEDRITQGANSESARESQKEQPETFKEDARRTIRDLNKQIRTLGNKAKSQWGEAETGAKEAWQDVKAKQKTAKNQVKELGSTGKDTWEQAKSKTKEALEELRKSFDKAKAYFK